ncbi:Uu.00g087680.m01.CDS01 [Anthostomella pinea]|uniref:Uu.00g087680.m01.CDS01 n=1 Tax=Anthostomella pinea TaxID=933095 RepID=A0AAI8VN05_9PEZI|nr:Uu.00g087680.m01.CDS01 [Anthostomella pinea]
MATNPLESSSWANMPPSTASFCSILIRNVIQKGPQVTGRLSQHEPNLMRPAGRDFCKLPWEFVEQFAHKCQGPPVSGTGAHHPYGDRLSTGDFEFVVVIVWILAIMVIRAVIDFVDGEHFDEEEGEEQTRPESFSLSRTREAIYWELRARIDG